jgi:hypothetical protein
MDLQRGKAWGFVCSTNMMFRHHQFDWQQEELGARLQARWLDEIERLDQRAHKLVALSLFLLTAYIVCPAMRVTA